MVYVTDFKQDAAPVSVNLPIIAGVLGLTYNINRIDEGFIGHGNAFESGLIFPRSFLFFQNLDDARRVHKNLMDFSEDTVLRSHAVLTQSNGCWLMVDSVDCSLNHYAQTHPWHASKAAYQKIIRDLLNAMIILNKEGKKHGQFDSRHILISKNKCKLAFIGGDDFIGKSDITCLSDVFKKLLVENSVEVNHFHAEVRKSSWKDLGKVVYHPVLMTPLERFRLPILADMRIRHWKMDFKIVIVDFNKMFPRNYTWQSKVWTYRGDYNAVFTDRIYNESAWDNSRYIRNAIQHVMEQARRVLKIGPAQVSTEEQIESELSQMFPGFLLKLYDFLDVADFEAK